MKFAINLILISIFLIGTSTSQSVVRNVNVLDVENKKILAGYDVVSVNGKIKYVGKAGKFKFPENTAVIDGSGRYLIPGLTDAHVHFFQTGGLYTRPDGIDLRKYKPYEDELKWAHEHMKDFLSLYLKAGITSVIDVGSTIEFLTQRDSFVTKTNSPLIYMTGPLLTTYVPEVYRNTKQDKAFTIMTNETDTRKLVTDQLHYKPDFIKIWYIVRDSNAGRGARVNLKLVKAAIDESHKHNLRVAVHASQRITAQLAVEAGADYLVHSVDDEVLSDSFVQLLKSRKTVLCPTLVVSGNYVKVFSGLYEFTEDELKLSNPQQVATITGYPEPDTALANMLIDRIKKGKSFARLKKADSISAINLKKLVEAGVTIATGTDAGNIGTQHAGSYYNELKAMADAGLNMWQLLTASTINGAKSIGKDKAWGSIKVGKTANMILLDGNPLKGLSNWKKIHTVINKGVVYADQPSDSLITDTECNRYTVEKMRDNNLWMTSSLRLNIPGSYCYNDEPENCRLYGRLYTWESANKGCSLLGDGWQLPTKDEWLKLAGIYAGVAKDSNDMRKKAYPRLLHSGDSRFNAVLGGERSAEGQYTRLEAHGFYWTATDNDSTAWFANFAKGSQALYHQPDGTKMDAFLVRCIKHIETAK